MPAHGHPAHPAARATLLLTCQVLSPWKKKKRAKPQTTEVLTMQSRGMSLMRSPLRSCGRGRGHRVGRSWQQSPSLPCPPLWARGGRGLDSHLHDNVEGEVEEEVADADGQQVGSEVIGADNEAIGSSGEAVGSAWGVPLPCPLSPKHVCSPREMRQSVRTPGCHSCRGTCHAGLTGAMSCLSSAQPRGGTAVPQERGGGGSRDGEQRGGIWHVPSSALTATS